MNGLEAMRGLCACSPRIENVVMFVSDSLRWDYLPRSVADRGVVFKTVASSLFTGSSFPSMVTGLHPPKHGVLNFFDRLGKSTTSLLNLDGYNTSLWNENTWLNCDPPHATPLHRLLRQDRRVPLEDLPSPFIYLEDEKGGHCPYGWPFEEEGYKYEEWECVRFIREHACDGREVLRRYYARSIERSVQVFERRLQTLERRGLTDRTLVVFTSDHGELLGEYGGHFGHGEIACPEVVYVPTVFIHPALPGGVYCDGGGVLRHVDFFPTIMGLLGREAPSSVDGVDTVESGSARVGYNHKETTVRTALMGVRLHHTGREISVWDENGGYVCRTGSSLKRLLLAIGKAFRGNGITEVYLRQNSKGPGVLPLLKDYFKVWWYYWNPRLRFGRPGFTIEDAAAVIRKVDLDARTATLRRLRRLKTGGSV